MTRPVVVDEPLGQDDRRRQVVPRAASRRRPRRRSTASRSASGCCGSKPAGRSDRPVSMIMVAGRVVVRRVRQRADQRPRWLRLASSGRCSQIWMPGVRVAIGLNSPRIVVGGVGLEVEAVVLRQPAGQEDVDHRLGPGRPASRASAAAARPERRQVIHPQPEQPDRPRLDREPSGEARVLGGGHRRGPWSVSWCSSPAPQTSRSDLRTESRMLLDLVANDAGRDVIPKLETRSTGS